MLRLPSNAFGGPNNVRQVVFFNFNIIAAVKCNLRLAYYVILRRSKMQFGAVIIFNIMAVENAIWGSHNIYHFGSRKLHLTLAIILNITHQLKCILTHQVAFRARVDFSL